MSEPVYLRKADGAGAIHRPNSETEKTQCGLFSVFDLVEVRYDPRKPWELCLKCKSICERIHECRRAQIAHDRRIPVQLELD